MDDISTLEKQIEHIQSLIEDKLEKLELELPIVPISKRPFFPGMTFPMIVESGPYYRLLKDISNSEDKNVALVLTNNEQQQARLCRFSDLHSIGVIGQIQKVLPLESGGLQVMVSIEKRCQILSHIHCEAPLKALVQVLEEPSQDLQESELDLKAYCISIIGVIKELLKLNPLYKEELQLFLSHSDFTEAAKLADFAAALTTASREEQQDVLATLDVRERLEKALLLLKKELEISQLQTRINNKIESNLNKIQREHFLKEQLKTIRRELGVERDEKQNDIQKFKDRVAAKKLPEEAKNTIDEELERLASLEPQMSEYGVCRNYLDWLTIVPWGKHSKEMHQLARAKKILDQDHFGLGDVKDRILEFISVSKLSGSVRGNILCLVGPPGVGKTSIAKSIAKALKREVFRFSVGGMKDEAEIKGHRRTYIGAMPGKLIQALKKCQTMNPVIILDEVDKIGSSYMGDPASALLEVLDPEQNNQFLDHYLDVPVDLSQVLFVLTANVLDKIPEPLKDRCEVIRLPGYISQEKIQIAQRFLLPRHKKEMGLDCHPLRFSKDALSTLIDSYARESGVRSLENQLKKILRKVATQIVWNEEKKTKEKISTQITSKNLNKYLGKPRFFPDPMHKKPPVGVAPGLAWTAFGGATLYVETLEIAAEKTQMQLTGQAGDVMKESASIAWSFAKRIAQEKGIAFFEKQEVHIHLPEGATPKDGPSAGITMASALLSLLLKKPLPAGLAMSGELTLNGRVLAVGGIREKILAAKRSDLSCVILPKANQNDYDELPAYLKEGLTARFADTYLEVFDMIFKKGK